MAYNAHDGASEQTFGPVFVPGQQIPKNSWLPKYPDQIEPPRSVVIAAIPFFFFTFALKEVPPPKLSWAPTYADFARSETVHPSRVPFLAQGPVKPVVPRGWVCYPDFVPLGGISVERQAAYFAPARQPLPPAPPGGLAEYPDFADAFKTHPSEAPWWSGPTRQPLPPTVTVTYPDGVDRTLRFDGATIYPLQPPAVATVALDWLPIRADQFVSYPEATYAKSAWLQELPRPPITPLSWSAIYPDGFAPPARVYPALVAPVAPVVAAVPQVWVVYPGPLPLLPAPWVEPRTFVPPPAQVVGWGAAYPDLIFERRLVAEGWITKPVLPPPTPFSAAIYPDAVVSLRVVSEGRPTWVPLPPQVSLDWLPTYPEAVRRPWATESLSPTTWINELPRPPLTPLSWAPTYPDFARAFVLPPSHQPWVTVYPLAPPTAPPAVAAYFPAHVDPPRALGVENQWTFVVNPFPRPDDITQFAWGAKYPDWIAPPSQLRPAAHPAYFAFDHPPILPVFSQVLVPAWVEHPFVEPRDWTVDIFTASITPPLAWLGWVPADLVRAWQVPPPAYFGPTRLVPTALAIHFTDEALSPGLFTDERLSGSLFTDEALVDPIFFAEHVRP